MKASIVSLLMIFGLSILIATPAKSELIPVASSKDGEQEYFIDTDTFNLDRSFITASIRIKYKTPLRTGASSATVRWGAKCSDRSYMFIESAHYDLNGILLGSNRKSSEWRVVRPGTVDEVIYNSMCNFRR